MTDFPPTDPLPTDTPSPHFPALSPDIIARAREMYDAATPNAQICEFLRMTRGQFLGFRKAQGWPLRDRFSVPPRKAPAWAQEEWEPPLDALEPEELIARLEAAAAREFARAERALDGGQPKNAEARLRIMATLVKMLAELKRMRAVKGDPPDPEPPGRDITELRAELMRRIDRYRETGSPT